MPAGKMFLAAKAGRRYRKRRATGFKKAVSKIARKVVLREAETKTGATSWSANFGASGVFYSVNGGGIWSSVTQGTGQSNRIGDAIKSLGVKARGYVSLVDTTITAGREYCGFRMVICTGKRPLTSGDMPQNIKQQIDPEVVTVLSDTMHKVDSQSWLKLLNKYIKFRRNVHYSGNVAIKNDLYIWLIPVPLGTGLTTSAGYTAQIDFQVYFKDV